MRVTAACDIDVLVGRVARVVGHHVDGVAIGIAMVDTGTRFVLEPAQLEVVEPGDDGNPGAPHPAPYEPTNDAQPAYVGSRP